MSKTVLITGSSTGFGRDTAETMAQAGYKVIASMRDPEGKNQQHAAELKIKGIDVVALDVTDQSSVDGAIRHILTTSGGLDILINNAGVASAGVTEAFTDTQAANLFDVNVIGVHRVTRAVLPIFRKQNDGLIINIGSILGRVIFPFFGLYCASKFAVEAMTDSLRYEVSQLGIDVSLIQPSAYPTNMYASADQPTDSDCVHAYGETGKIPGAMFEHFQSLFESSSAPNLHDVAEAILKVANTAKGKRPARTVVGSSFGADTLNDATAPVQADAVEGLGLSHLKSVSHC